MPDPITVVKVKYTLTFSQPGIIRQSQKNSLRSTKVRGFGKDGAPKTYSIFSVCVDRIIFIAQRNLVTSCRASHFFLDIIKANTITKETK